VDMASVTEQRHPRHRTVIVVASLVLLILTAGPILGWVRDRLGPPFAYPFDDRAFEPTLWRQSRDPSDSPRGKMVDHLIATKLRRGMSEREVRRLLGEPDHKQRAADLYPDQGFPATDLILSYHLGMWSGLRMDGDFLAIHFDRSGRLVGAWHYQS
jgi:hypothetical protein